MIAHGLGSAQLLAESAAAYGLAFSAAEQVPGGEVAVCYRLTSPAGLYFLKCWRANRQGRWAIGRLAHYMPVIRYLYDSGLFTALAAPLPTRSGALWTQAAGVTVAVFPWIAGPTLPYTVWPPSVTAALAGRVARLHQVTPAVTTFAVPREAFDLGFVPELQAGLAALDGIGPHERAGLRALRALLQPQRAGLIGLLARAEALQAEVRAHPGPFVLCHTDIHGGNMIIDSQGQLTILDWETMRLAPPEHDVQAALDSDFARFIAEYRTQGGQWPLTTQHFAFYLARRYLADLTDWLVRILHENTTPAQDDSDLAGIAEECLAKAATFEDTVSDIAAVLRSHA